MNEPLWKLLELTIKTQLSVNPDAACNTLESFINTHVHGNPSYSERLVIIRRLDNLLLKIESDLDPKPLKEVKKRMKESYSSY